MFLSDISEIAEPIQEKSSLLSRKFDSLDVVALVASFTMPASYFKCGGDIGKLCRPQISSVAGTLVVAKITRLFYSARWI